MDQSGAVNRIHQGWALTKVSWTVLRSDRSLAAFPVLAAIAALLARQLERRMSPGTEKR